jgi:hypothetical protein
MLENESLTRAQMKASKDAPEESRESQAQAQTPQHSQLFGVITDTIYLREVFESEDKEINLWLVKQRVGNVFKFRLLNRPQYKE